jgi:hypothetical protein
MGETEEANSRRADIAMRNRRRTLESRERKLTMAVFGLMAYSAFANVVSGAMLLTASSLDAGLGLILGALYSLGAYRIWFKDDIRWWPVAVPAGISVAVLILAWLGGVQHPIPLLLNTVLLVLVPIRRRAVAAVPNISFKADGSAAA